MCIYIFISDTYSHSKRGILFTQLIYYYRAYAYLRKIAKRYMFNSTQSSLL